MLNWAGHMARTGQTWNINIILLEKPLGKYPFGRPRRRWEVNININIASKKIWVIKMRGGWK